VITIKYADQDPPTSYANKTNIDPWLAKLEAATKGKVKIDLYHSQTLSKGKDLWDAAKYGISDISWNFHGYHPGMTPLADVVTLTFPLVDNGQQNALALWTLYEEFPEIEKSFDDNKIIAFFSNTYDSIATTPKVGPVKTMEDLKGLKIRCPGRMPSNAMKAMGGVPAMISAPDLYLSLQKGTIDGLVMSAGFAGNFRLDEVLEYYCYITFVANYFSMAMNWDTWNKKLPDDVKAAWEKERLIGRGATELIGGWVDGFIGGFPEWAVAQGSTMVKYDLPAEEAARWRAIGGEAIWEAWVAEMEGKGLPGQKVFDRYVEVVKEVKAKYPAQ